MPVLIVIDQPPYGRWDGRESLDMAFALAAFDKPVSLLFRGSGVFWLLSNQAGAAIDQKTVSSNLGAAPVFGVENLYADARALTTWPTETMLIPDIKVITPDPDFYRSFTQVIQP